MAEREQGLEVLHQRQEKTRDSLTRTATVVRTLGTPEIANWLDLSRPSDDFFKRADKVEEIKGILNNKAIPTLQERLSDVSNQISTFDTRVAEARANLQSVRERVEKGVLPPVAVETAENMLAELEGGDLVRVRPKVRDERRIESKKPELPKITIDLTNGQFTSHVSGWEVKPGNREDFKLLVYLAKHKGKWVSSLRLTKALKLRTRPSAIINRLRKYIEEKPGDPKILISTGENKGTRYLLDANVEFVGESTHAKRSREGYEVSVVELFGQRIEVKGKLQIKLLETLKNAMSPETAVESNDLAFAVYGKKDAETARLLSGMVSVSRRILKDYHIQIIQPIGPLERRGGKKAKYYLEKIEKREKKQWHSPDVAKQGKLAALELFADNPSATFEDVLKLFGERDKSGRLLARHHLVFGLTGLVNRLAFRKLILGEEITADEQRILDKVSNLIGGVTIGNPAEDLKRFRSHAIEHFAAIEEGRVPKEVKSEEIISDEETLLLVHLIKDRRDILERFNLPTFPQENLSQMERNLIERINSTVIVTPERVEEVRKSAIAKLRNLARNYSDELVDSQSSEVQDLLIYFMDTDAEPVAEIFEELLRTKLELKYVKESKTGPVRHVWRDVVSVEASSLKTETLPKDIKGTIQEGVQKKVSAEPKDVRQAEKRTGKKEAKPTAIEGADPKVRERIGRIINRIEDKKLHWPLTNPQVTKFFPKLKAKFVSKAHQNGYIRPERGKDHHPVFNKSEVALLLYLGAFGNNLTPRQFRDLKKLVKEEIARLASGKR